MLANHGRAVMAKQPEGRFNACWVAPVVALAKFYATTREEDTNVLVASVLALSPEDPEDVIEMFERFSGRTVDKPSVWSNDNDFFEDRSSTNDDGAADCEWMGPTSEVVYGHTELPCLGSPTCKRRST